MRKIRKRRKKKRKREEKEKEAADNTYFGIEQSEGRLKGSFHLPFPAQFIPRMASERP